MFARMPHLNPVPGDLNALAEETVANFRAANPGIEFELELASASAARSRSIARRLSARWSTCWIMPSRQRSAQPATAARPRIEVRTADRRERGGDAGSVRQRPGIDPR